MSALPGLLIFGPPSFLLGVLVGRYLETHKETRMTLRDLHRRARAYYDALAPALFFALAIVSTIGVWLAATAMIQNGKDLVTSCQNGNQQRVATASLWTYVADVSQASNPDPTRREERFYRDFRGYIQRVFERHDCHDLSRRYPIPDPPRILGAHKEKP